VGDVLLTTRPVKHRRRLAGGALLATSPHVDWRALMRRTFGFDSLVCPTFQTTMRVVELAGDPTWDQTDLAFDVA
jgi:hypothetical protein